ncbi:DUF4249 domain-containing protein [Mariniflexile ostreae]|uniref:DUF4249 domain-containing protein n=1 Tax=Mariniflexile ostreae TaxID=1520892 RepID=A0ABV5FES5_9FLAO
MRTFLFILTIILCMVSCQDVIEVQVPTSEPRLVIDASIKWLKGTSGSQQSIKLSLTAPYFDTEVPAANQATVTITDADGSVFNFIEEEDTGVYKNNNFIPVLGGVYTLTIIYNQETYTATETLMAVTPIDSVTQKNNSGFSGEAYALKAFYSDPPNQENFYFFEFSNNNLPVVSLEVYNDEFTDGNQIFAFYSDSDTALGDEITISNHGISKQFYDFMFILLQQTADQSGGPFEVQPATVRGNCINQTNPDNFPLGYFRLSETDQVVHIIK